ncbi:3-methyl-2-oxobutanoate hydroxymethyltransferase, partial [Streptomyces sp. tea 10]|nr:3-methyl-2-oxobutanoate hydroxymethyltransferase [Streptomyces sp. tea 10]
MSETQPSSGSPAEKSLAQIARVRTLHLQRAKDAGEKFSMLTSYDTLTAGIFDRAGVDVLLVGDSLGNTVLGLRGESDVTHDRDPSAHHGGHVLRERFPRLDLHGVRAGLLHDPHRAAHGLIRGLLVRAEGQVHDHEAALYAADDRRGERDHVLERDRLGGLVSEHRVAERLSHEKVVLAGSV